MRRARALPARAGAEARATPAQRRCLLPCEAPESAATTRPPSLCEAARRPAASTPRPEERPSICPVTQPHGAAPPPRRRPGPCKAPEDVAPTRPRPLCEPLPRRVAPTPRPGERPSIGPVARPHGAAPPPPRCPGLCEAPEDVAPTRLPPLREASPRPVALPSRPGERPHIGPVARPHGAAPPSPRRTASCDAAATRRRGPHGPAGKPKIASGASGNRDAAATRRRGPHGPAGKPKIASGASGNRPLVSRELKVLRGAGQVGRHREGVVDVDGGGGRDGWLRGRVGRPRERQ